MWGKGAKFLVISMVNNCITFQVIFGCISGTFMLHILRTNQVFMYACSDYFDKMIKVLRWKMTPCLCVSSRHWSVQPWHVGVFLGWGISVKFISPRLVTKTWQFCLSLPSHGRSSSTSPSYSFLPVFFILTWWLVSKGISSLFLALIPIYFISCSSTLSALSLPPSQ